MLESLLDANDPILAAIEELLCELEFPIELPEEWGASPLEDEPE